MPYSALAISRVCRAATTTTVAPGERPCLDSPSVLRKLLLVVGVVILVGGGAAVAWIGPRNIIGILRYDTRREGTLRVGDAAPDVTLVDLDGKTPVALRERMGGRPLVMIFGSFT